ncbi:chaperone modulator CbpM [Dictyobacter aurantiacus]|uniref:MerR family transcriptional regulator n=1 Tax=Dictyobacter aurantiacus TaxID=1936993 RepID=A0A401ZND7_9CHLR|nr:chaperone modulator CbpM [Dictyobacter aurantiacus]GCE08371.1 hypothetical protein KDAU_57000 [Dictyobacter aurantiacus]
MNDPQFSRQLTKIIVLGQNESYSYSESEILEWCRLEQPFVSQLAEEGLVGRLDSASMQYYYCDRDLRLLRRAYRLQRDLDINPAGIEVILRLLMRIDELQRAHPQPDQPSEPQS